jgi:hypothetical protein
VQDSDAQLRASASKAIDTAYAELDNLEDKRERFKYYNSRMEEAVAATATLSRSDPASIEEQRDARLKALVLDKVLEGYDYDLPWRPRAFKAAVSKAKSSAIGITLKGHFEAIPMWQAPNEVDPTWPDADGPRETWATVEQCEYRILQ